MASPRKPDTGGLGLTLTRIRDQFRRLRARACVQLCGCPSADERAHREIDHLLVKLDEQDAEIHALRARVAELESALDAARC